MATFTVNHTNDDGYKASDWYTDGPLEAGARSGGATSTIGVRFTSVSIPKNATIISAKITFYGYSDSSYTVNLKIYGIDEDNTATMSSDPTGRTKTAANSDWDSNSQSEDTAIDTSSIVSSVQEIVNRDGWSSGNAMGFLILNDGSDTDRTRTLYDYELNSDFAAVLVVTYSTAGSSASPSISPSTSVSPSPSPSISPSISVSPSPSPSVSPSPEDYGLKITKSGYDVKTETDIKNMVFTSARGVLGLKQLTSYTKTTDASGNIDATEAHGVGYVPITIVSFTAYDGNQVLCPIEWLSIYLNAPKETIEVTETVSFSIDATNIRFIVHAEEYNWDLDTTANISGRNYTFNVYYYFNELVETA